MKRSPKWWDCHFIDIAKLIASASKDPSTKCGSVIVRPDKSIASTGFNGFPKGCDDSPAKYEDRELKYSRVVHAELNAILQAAESLRGYTLYVYPIPTCDRCAAAIIQAGISRVVYVIGADDSRWTGAFERAKEMYKEAGVEIENVSLHYSFD